MPGITGVLQSEHSRGEETNWARWDRSSKEEGAESRNTLQPWGWCQRDLGRGREDSPSLHSKATRDSRLSICSWRRFNVRSASRDLRL